MIWAIYKWRQLRDILFCPGFGRERHRLLSLKKGESIKMLAKETSFPSPNCSGQDSLGENMNITGVKLILGCSIDLSWEAGYISNSHQPDSVEGNQVPGPEGLGLQHWSDMPKKNGRCCESVNVSVATHTPPTRFCIYETGTLYFFPCCFTPAQLNSLV